MCAVQKKRAARNTSNSNEDGVFTEEEGKSECEVSANETRVGSNEDAKFGDERDARVPGGGGE